MTTYQKSCHVCHKPFDSEARNTKYCGEECTAAAKKRHTSRGRKRRLYRKDVDNRRAQSMSRKQAREYCIAEHAIGTCTRCGVAKFIKDLEDHHRDGDPFNNDRDNLTLQCKKCHPKSDTDWRKEKAAGQPIADVRKYLQVGSVVLCDHQVLLVLPGGDHIDVSTHFTAEVKDGFATGDDRPQEQPEGGQSGVA